MGCQISKNLRISVCIRIGQRGTFDLVCIEMVVMGLLIVATVLQFTQTSTATQLVVKHRNQVIPEIKTLVELIGFVIRHNSCDGSFRKSFQNLGKSDIPKHVAGSP
jgi:hypothetical protein